MDGALAINSQTGVISGVVADGAQNSSPYSVSVNATDGTHSATVFFNWTVAKSFAVVNPGTQIFPENLPVFLQMQALNGSAPYTYSATGLPLALQIDPNTGLISGVLADYVDSSGHYLNFSVTVSATDSTHQTVSTTFTFGTEPGFYLTGVGDRSNRAGDVVVDFMGALNGDQNATLVASLTGLPPGLTYDPSPHLVTGTIASSAFTASPYLTTVTVVNQTFNYTYSTTFNWAVTPASTSPTSSVAALPQYETSTSFTVSWSGADAGGPGIAAYSIYFSTNGGAFVFHADGSFTYAPPASFPGFDYAQYTASDSLGQSAKATVNVLSQAGGVVWKFYESVLNRDPDHGGLQSWINDFVHGGKTGDIAAGFFESDELLNQIIGGYYQQYQRILNRTPDPQGFQFWLQQLANRAPESEVALGFFDSLEADRNNVTGVASRPSWQPKTAYLPSSVHSSPRRLRFEQPPSHPLFGFVSRRRASAAAQLR